MSVRQYAPSFEPGPWDVVGLGDGVSEVDAGAEAERRRGRRGLRRRRDPLLRCIRGGLRFEALELVAARVDTDLGVLRRDLEPLQRGRRGLRVARAPVGRPLRVGDALQIDGALLHGAVRQPGDLHLDRVARQRDVGFADAEGVDAVADVLQRLLHGVRRCAVGRRQDHRYAALEVQAEHRLQPAARERGDRQSGYDRHDHDRHPQTAAALHASSCPFANSWKRASIANAAWRHICILPRKISKYSMTWLILVSIVSSKLTVRASESTRRKLCSTA